MVIAWFDVAIGRNGQDGAVLLADNIKRDGQHFKLCMFAHLQRVAAKPDILFGLIFGCKMVAFIGGANLAFCLLVPQAPNRATPSQFGHW
jgi:hypothetical protein